MNKVSGQATFLAGAARNIQAKMPQKPLRLGGQVFPVDELIVMAIVQRTPDSFYDKGATFAAAAAVAAAERALDAGATIVDISAGSRRQRVRPFRLPRCRHRRRAHSDPAR